MSNVFPDIDVVANDQEIQAAMTHGYKVCTQHDGIKVTAYVYNDCVYITNVE